MVDPKAVAALVTGVLLAAVGGLGTLVVLVGALAGVMEWTGVAWLLVLAFVAGGGLTAFGAVALADALWDAVSGGDIGALTEEFDASRLRQLVD